MHKRRVKKALRGGAVLLVLTFFQSVLLPQVTDSVEEAYFAALRQIGQDHFDDGISELRRIIRENPGYAKPYRNLVETYIFVDQLDRAQVFFEGILQDHPENAYAYYALARLDFARSDYDHAIEKLKNCIELDSRFADAYSHRGGLPEVYRAKGDLDSAVRFFEQLVAKEPENACAYYGLARCYIRKFQWDKAIDLSKKAIRLAPELTLAYHAQIFANFSMSRNEEVLELSQQLLDVAKNTDDPEMSAYAGMMIGTSYRQRGDYLKALQYLSETVKIAKSIGDKSREGISLNNLANVYYSLGDFAKALPYLHEALFLIRKVGNKPMELLILNSIGNIHKADGRNEKATRYYREVLGLARLYGYKGSENHALSNLASVLKERGDYESALQYRKAALKIAKETKNKTLEGFEWSRLGSLYCDLMEYDASSDNYYKALKIGQEIGNVQLIWQTESGLAATFAGRGHQKEAIRHYANAISLYDSVRTSLDIESLTLSFLEAKHEPYPAIVRLLAELGEYQKAFLYSEKYKAKSLLENLSQGQSLASTALSDSLRMQIQQINSQIEATHRQLSTELSKTESSRQNALRLQQRITNLKLKKAFIIADLKRQHNIYFELTSPKLVEVEEIQSQLLAKGQAIIDYVIGPESLSIFAITSDSLIYHQVAVTRDSLKTMLAALSPVFHRSTNTNTNTLSAQLADFSVYPSHSLYNAILKPVETHLRNIQEITIVPDDFLNYLPFEMLVSDTIGVETPYDFYHAKLLLEKYAISYASSASLLNPKIQRNRKADKGILALANPNFKRLEDTPLPSEWLATKALDVGNAVRGDGLVSLPHSESEVRAINAVFESSENEILLGGRATESEFKNAAQGFSILHLATHFLPMDDQPLYSKIALTQDPSSPDDGYLQTYEVFNLELDADLVVLSACNTASGRLRKGEGVIGIARAFQHAGVPSLLASLWSVDDASTEAIMKAFYQHIKEGYGKNKALQLAKLDFLRSSDNANRDPFYWAPFVLIGDRSPIQLPIKDSRNLWPLWLSLLLMTVVVFWLLRNRVRLRNSSGPF